MLMHIYFVDSDFLIAKFIGLRLCHGFDTFVLWASMVMLY